MKAQVKQHNGTPTLFLDDKPVYANIHLFGGWNPDGMDATLAAIRRFASNGIHIYSLDSLSSEWNGPRSGGPGEYEFAETAPRLQRVLKADPDALFLLRTNFETHWQSPKWWNELHPDDVEVLSDGSRWGASYASSAWQEDVSNFLRGYIDHLKSAGLYERVIAYQIGTGTCSEWIKSWVCMDAESGDFSPVMRQDFRAWLRARYHDDPAALQAAWAELGVTFETAEVPSGAEQAITTQGLFRDPRRERKVVDFYECYAEAAADSLLSICRNVRNATHGEKLTGAFFGYIMDLAWNNAFFVDGHRDQQASEVSTTQRSGHLGLRKVLRSPDLDFLVSPYSYAFRGLGGDGLPMQPTESLRVHGKLYLLEEDTLMHNNFDPGKRMHPISRSVAIYHRHFAQVLTHGIGITWMENSDLAEDPSLVPVMQRWHKRYDDIGQWAVQLDRAPGADVAVFLDDLSFMYEANRNDIDISLIAHQRVMSLNRFGAPHDLYLLEDLLDGGLPPYKLYIFLNPFHLNDRQRRTLHQILGQGGRTALWMYGAGYLNSDADGQAVSLDNMTELTGFRFGMGRSYWSAMMHLTDFTHPITRGLPQDFFWGTTRAIAPIFHLADPEATVLGEVIYGLGRCQPGLGIKTVQPAASEKPFNSVYAATPGVPASVLRGIARHAGAHLYNEDGDVLYATPELLSVHTVSGGERNFKLPRQVEVVYDLLCDRVLGRDVDQFCDALAPGSTTLYYAGSAEQLEGLKS
jgi:hypothetical protein